MIDFLEFKKDQKFKIQCIRIPFLFQIYILPVRMSKRQRLSFFHFEGLPDEIILKIFSLLDIKGVLHCGQVSKRLRDISNDQGLWSKLNLSGREVPYDFIKKAIQNGCEYLDLSFSLVNGGKKAEETWKLKYLKISQSADEWDQCDREVPEGVLQNCHFLQKLAVDNLILNSREIEQICQNGETLQNLSLEGCDIGYYHRTELIQKLFTKCHQLTELNIYKYSGNMVGNNILLDQHICALVDNLTPNILRLNFGCQESVQDKHVKTLVRRCNKITELDLSGTSITNDSVESIITHLKTLEKLDLDFTDIDFSKILQLKSIPTLKILRCFYGVNKENTEKIKNLKQQLPQIRINEDDFQIASSTKEVNGSIDPDWFWEIRAEQQDLFPKSLI